MTKKALLFGSIGSVVETSDIQRRSYNDALREAGVDWEWDRETYSDLLAQVGGKERLSFLARATGTALDTSRIEDVHARKTALACDRVEKEGVALRPGVVEIIALAKERGMKLGFVTTTYAPNVDAVFAAAGDELPRDDFATIITRDDVARGKPAPDAYEAALLALGVDPADAIAIEDTANSVMSAKRAGIDVIAVPGELTSGQDFWQADLVLDSLLEGGAVDPRVVELLA